MAVPGSAGRVPWGTPLSTSAPQALLSDEWSDETHIHGCCVDGEKVCYLPSASPDSEQVLVLPGWMEHCTGSQEPWALSPPLPQTCRVTLKFFSAVRASVSLPHGEVVAAGGPLRSHPALVHFVLHVGKDGTTSAWRSLASRQRRGPRLCPQLVASGPRAVP